MEWPDVECDYAMAQTVKPLVAVLVLLQSFTGVFVISIFDADDVSASLVICALARGLVHPQRDPGCSLR